jgi:hypothetical protein
MSYLQGSVIGEISLQDVDVGPPAQLFRDVLLRAGLVTNQTNDRIGWVLGYLAKELELGATRQLINSGIGGIQRLPREPPRRP